MTVEVLLMNRTSAALAADSAVSIRSADMSRLITQNGVVKNFILNADSASGMMIYGVAEFCGCPWATVVDKFRQRGLGGEATLGETADAMVRLLTSLADTDLVPTSSGDLLFRIFASQVMLDLHRRFEDALVPPQSLKPAEALSAALSDLTHDVEFEMVFEGDEPKSAPRPRIGSETPRLTQVFDRNMEDIIDRAMMALFPRTLDTPDLRQGLARTIRIGLLTDWMPPDSPYTGVVIAGFGTADVSPSFIELHVIGLIGDLLKYRVVAHERVGPDNPVIIRSFAQNGAVDRFLYGADEEFVGSALRRTYAYAKFGIADAAAQAKLDPVAAAELWNLVDEAIFRASLFGLWAARDAWRDEIEASFDQKVRTASVEPLGALAAQLLGLPLLESDMIGNATVSRPFSILRLSKAGAALTSQTEIM